MTREFTGIIEKKGSWYIGHIEEIPGVNTQGKTLKEVKENLKEALYLILEANQELSAKEHSKSKIIKEPISVEI